MQNADKIGCGVGEGKLLEKARRMPLRRFRHRIMLRWILKRWVMSIACGLGKLKPLTPYN